VHRCAESGRRTLVGSRRCVLLTTASSIARFCITVHYCEEPGKYIIYRANSYNLMSGIDSASLWGVIGVHPCESIATHPVVQTLDTLGEMINSGRCTGGTDANVYLSVIGVRERRLSQLRYGALLRGAREVHCLWSQCCRSHVWQR
jgi:hypothetical protein